MYWCKLFANEEYKWSYGLPWRVFEEPAMVIVNSRGVEKLTADI